MKTIVGIDPGYTGAIAVLSGKGEILELIDIPTLKDHSGRTRVSLGKLSKIFQAFKDKYGTMLVCIEKAQAFSNQGVTSMFRYGEGYGNLCGVAVAHEFWIEEVRAGEWKKDLGVTSDKETCRQLADKMWPHDTHRWGLKKHHGRIEAALIGHWSLDRNIKTRK